MADLSIVVKLLTSTSHWGMTAMDRATSLKWTDVESSNVRRVAYHEESKTLAVEFHNGGLYTYHAVDADIFVGLVHAQSVGKYLNSVIKVLHPYDKFNSLEELHSSLG